MSTVITWSQSRPRCLVMTLALSGSPSLKTRSCLAYPKYGMTSVIVLAPRRLTASCSRNISIRFPSGYVFWTITTSSFSSLWSILV